MTTIHKESGVKKGIIPQQLIETSQLLASIDRRLEDCALEWQSEISHRQWKLFNAKSMGDNLSLLSRTYFAEKNLDEAFQHLLSCNKIFSDCLGEFVCLLQSSTSISTSKASDAQNQCSALVDSWKPSNDVDDVDRCPSKLVQNVLGIRNCFADLLRTKVSFDTKFLSFEAILHKTTSAPTDSSCSNSNIKRSKRKSRISQPNRIAKTKRLTRSAKSIETRDKDDPGITIGDTCDHISLETGTNLL